MGFFADVGPMQIFVSVHLIPPDLKFYPDANPPNYQNEEQVIEKGSMVRVKIMGLRMDVKDIVTSPLHSIPSPQHPLTPQLFPRPSLFNASPRLCLCPRILCCRSLTVVCHRHDKRGLPGYPLMYQKLSIRIALALLNLVYIYLLVKSILDTKDGWAARPRFCVIEPSNSSPRLWHLTNNSKCDSHGLTQVLVIGAGFWCSVFVTLPFYSLNRSYGGLALGDGVDSLRLGRVDKSRPAHGGRESVGR